MIKVNEVCSAAVICILGSAREVDKSNTLVVRWSASNVEALVLAYINLKKLFRVRDFCCGCLIYSELSVLSYIDVLYLLRL